MRFHLIFFAVLAISTGYYCINQFPTDPFTILELQNPSHDVPELRKSRRSPDLEALKLRKGWSGCSKKYIQGKPSEDWKPGSLPTANTIKIYLESMTTGKKRNFHCFQCSITECNIILCHRGLTRRSLGKVLDRLCPAYFFPGNTRATVFSLWRKKSKRLVLPWDCRVN